MYPKPPLTSLQQVQLLESRGMGFKDPVAAARFLEDVNYYRLRAYWVPFEKTHTSLSHWFPSAVSFEQVVALYRFDRKLRLFVADILERIEISVRTQWAYVLSHRLHAFAHEDPANFSNPSIHAQGLAQLVKTYEKSKETFAVHHRAAYPTLQTPPIWVASELLTFGELSLWIHNLKPHCEPSATLFERPVGRLISFLQARRPERCHTLSKQIQKPLQPWSNYAAS